MIAESPPLTGDALIARKTALILEGVGVCCICDGTGKFFAFWRGDRKEYPQACDNCQGTGRSDDDGCPF